MESIFTSTVREYRYLREETSPGRGGLKEDCDWAGEVK